MMTNNVTSIHSLSRFLFSIAPSTPLYSLPPSFPSPLSPSLPSPPPPPPPPRSLRQRPVATFPFTNTISRFSSKLPFSFFSPFRSFLFACAWLRNALCWSVNQLIRSPLASRSLTVEYLRHPCYRSLDFQSSLLSDIHSSLFYLWGVVLNQTFLKDSKI